MIEFFTLFSSSSGNCTYLTDGEKNILIDAGVSAKRITQGLKEYCLDIGDIDAILITHEHCDHIAGADVLSRRYKIPVYANECTLLNMRLSSEAFNSANVFKTNDDFFIGDIKIKAFNTPHDTPESVGFTFEFLQNGKKIGYASDLGHISNDVKENLIGCDFVYIESNHDTDMLFNGPYPYFLKKRVSNDNGHLSNEVCAKFLSKICNAKTSRVMLGHLSRQNNYPKLAFNAAHSELSKNNIKINHDILLYIAPSAGMSDIIKL